MPQPANAAASDAATPRFASEINPPDGNTNEAAEDTPPFPADTTALFVTPSDFGQDGVSVHRFSLANAHHAVLHVRLSTPADAPYLSVSPQEAALGPGEKQTVAVYVDAALARKQVVGGGAAPQAPVQIAYHRLFPSVRNVAPTPIGTGTVLVQLPIAACPHCARSLDDTIQRGIAPEVCPFCFERLRVCPVCGALNSWLARRCVRNPNHVVRAEADWPMLGGDAQHGGFLPLSRASGDAAPLALSRKWSFPMHPPTRREHALTWSAPACAYGMVAACASTPDGESHLYAWDARTGAPLWEPYPLPHPVYPDRGGIAFAHGKLFAATVEGTCLCLDAQRGTRLWEISVGGRVFGAVVPASLGHHALLLAVCVANHSGMGGKLAVIDTETARVVYTCACDGIPDAAPAFSGRLVFFHDDSGHITAFNLISGNQEWRMPIDVGTDAAPLVADNRVFSATGAGVVWCHDALTGEKKWSLPVTNASFDGTPACDGTLLYLPAGDGLHLVSMATGQAVRRYQNRFAIRSAPLLLGDNLVYGSTDGNVYGGFAARTPEKQYETGTVGSQIVAPLAFSGGTVFAAATNGVLYALHGTSLEKAGLFTGEEAAPVAR